MPGILMEIEYSTKLGIVETVEDVEVRDSYWNFRCLGACETLTGEHTGLSKPGNTPLILHV